MSTQGYRRVADSEGPRRAFRVTLGLRQGYGPDGRLYDIEEAVRAGTRWMQRRAAAGEHFLTGMFTRGDAIYLNADDGHAPDREPVAIFSGEVLLGRPGGDLPDVEVMALLDDLAAEVGRSLGAHADAAVRARDGVQVLVVSAPLAKATPALRAALATVKKYAKG